MLTARRFVSGARAGFRGVVGRAAGAGAASSRGGVVAGSVLVDVGPIVISETLLSLQTAAEAGQAVGVELAGDQEHHRGGRSDAVDVLCESCVVDEIGRAHV